MFCKYCGKTIDNDTVYCPQCGKNQTCNDNDTSSRIRETPPIRDDKHYENRQNRPPVSVSFLDAIKNYYSNYANFSGRAVRSEYWWGFLYNIIASILLNCLPENFAWLTFVWSIVHLIPGISICIRRLHDVDKSGGFYFICLIFSMLPIIFALMMLFQQVYFISLVFCIISLISSTILLYNLCKRSSFSDNLWGLSPYDTGHEYNESQTWRCPKCGCRTPNSYLTCKNCGEIKPTKSRTPQHLPPQKSKKCVCGEIVYGNRCPNCGREM